ncbi:MAG: hypothetical protein Q8M07_08985 [Prosthecobacter sp.]|nr:hypothetical protein [Prosthecobacter sp.]
MPSSLWHRLSFQRLLLLVLSMLGSSCAGMKNREGIILVIDREDVRTWNPLNVWAESATAPNHYFPRGMKKGTPLDETHGRWVIDPQDNWRFYVPHNGTSLYSRQLLDEMAKTATNQHSKKIFPLLFLGRLIEGVVQSAGNLPG